MSDATVKAAEEKVSRLLKTGMDGTPELSAGIVALLDVWELRVNAKLKSATKDDQARLRAELARITAARGMLRVR